jgi:hypothetical protein
LKRWVRGQTLRWLGAGNQGSVKIPLGLGAAAAWGVGISLLSRCGAACHRVGRLAACAVQKDIQCLSVYLSVQDDVMDAAISNEIIYHEASKFHEKVA